MKIKYDSKKLNVTVAGNLILGGDLKQNMNVKKKLNLKSLKILKKVWFIFVGIGRK